MRNPKTWDDCENLYIFQVGNPETENYYDSKGLLEFAWSHAVISDEQYEKAKQVCDFKQSQWSNECNQAMNDLYNDYSEIDIYNIYAPACRLNTTSSVTSNVDYRFKRMRIFGGYDPCYSSYAEEYFNRVDVQSSLHANSKTETSKISWKVCK